MKIYYLNDGAKNIGPFSKEELRERKITKETMVWKEGFENWKNAGEIDELKIILLSIPTHPKQSNEIKHQPISSKKKGYLKYLITAAGAIIFIALVSNNSGTDSSNTQEKFLLTAEEDNNREIRNQIQEVIKTSTNQYSINDWGGITNLDIITYNNSDYTMDEIKIAIDYIKENGGVYKTEIITFYNIPPHQNKALSTPDSNRGLSVNTSVLSIKSSELNLCYSTNIIPAIGDPDPFKCK